MYMSIYKLTVAPFMKGLGCNLIAGVTDELPKCLLNWPWVQLLVIEVFSVKLAYIIDLI
jgi:hypothetical protein